MGNVVKMGGGSTYKKSLSFVIKPKKNQKIEASSSSEDKDAR